MSWNYTILWHWASEPYYEFIIPTRIGQAFQKDAESFYSINKQTIIRTKIIWNSESLHSIKVIFQKTKFRLRL